MFFQPPEKEPTNTSKTTASQKSIRRKRRKKAAQKNKNKKSGVRKAKHSHSQIATTMSSWAENFTMAATWQLKHQVAHWKSKARSLEYENRILRDMLRHYYVHGNASNADESDEVMSVNNDNSSESEEEIIEKRDDSEEEDEVQVSEEFVEFLKVNVEFRKAREERLRQKKLDEEMPLRQLEAGPQEPPKDNTEELKMLYGDSWQRISALELSLQTQFMSDCDKVKPIHWPNIPLRI